MPNQWHLCQLLSQSAKQIYLGGTPLIMPPWGGGGRRLGYWKGKKGRLPSGNATMGNIWETYQSSMAFLPIAVDMSDRLGISIISDLAKTYSLAIVAQDQDMAGTWEYSLLLHLMHSASPMYCWADFHYLLSMSEFTFTICVRIYIQCLCQNLHHPNFLNPWHSWWPLESQASSTSLWCPSMY